MSILYSWKIRNVFLETEGSTDPSLSSTGESLVTTGLNKFIQSVGVTITGTDGTYSSEFETTAHLYHNPNTNYMNYDSITTEHLIEWSQAAIGGEVRETIEKQLEREIQDQLPLNDTSKGLVAWP